VSLPTWESWGLRSPTASTIGLPELFRMHGLEPASKTAWYSGILGIVFQPTTNSRLHGRPDRGNLWRKPSILRCHKIASFRPNGDVRLYSLRSVLLFLEKTQSPEKSTLGQRHRRYGNTKLLDPGNSARRQALPGGSSKAQSHGAVSGWKT